MVKKIKEKSYFEMLISVILPTYNAEKTIARAIDSVYKQKIDNQIEIIIVDDNSSDRTIEIIKSFKNTNNLKFKYIKNKINMGSGFSRKVAIENATGYFIAFLDSDDYWLENKLYNQLKFLQKNSQIDFVYTDYLKEFMIQKNLFLHHIKMPKFVSLEKNKFINYIPNSSVLIKSHIAKKIPYPLIRMRNDFLYWNQILLSNKNLKAWNSNLGKPLFVYGYIPGISRKSLNLIVNQWQLYRNHFNYSLLKSVLGLLINILNSIINIIKTLFFYFFK